MKTFDSFPMYPDKINKSWTDDSFIPIESGDLETFGIQTAVVMNVLCSSHTFMCRNKCGCITKDLSPSLTECPKCNVSLINYNQCINCETLHTSQWRTLNSRKLFNACYLYNITHKSHRLESNCSVNTWDLQMFTPPPHAVWLQTKIDYTNGWLRKLGYFWAWKKFTISPIGTYSDW